MFQYAPAGVMPYRLVRGDVLAVSSGEGVRRRGPPDVEPPCSTRPRGVVIETA
ncbi:hypothetical protein ACIG3E_33805 [Streptomyces sp. NPDC053474]|uniref:hypothetical protein n=1 Tax=Streptomyces sp. NPDC053474 TaxID=3365704 RepID=UPI0037D6E285